MAAMTGRLMWVGDVSCASSISRAHGNYKSLPVLIVTGHNDHGL